MSAPIITALDDEEGLVTVANILIAHSARIRMSYIAVSVGHYGLPEVNEVVKSNRRARSYSHG